MSSIIIHRIHLNFMGAFVLGGLLLSAACDDHDHHHADGAHVHGVAQLDIALESAREIGFEFRAPAESIYGFEYAAKSDADKAKQSAALARLEADFAGLVGLPADANCTASEIDVHVEAPGDDHDSSHDHGHSHDHGDNDDEHAEDRGHREVHVTAVFQCASDVSGGKLAPQMFNEFANLQSLQIQLIGTSEQRSATLSRGGKRELAL